MAARRKLHDQQAGPLPEIRSEGESVVFYLEIARPGTPGQLILRCDEHGNVWASVAPATSRRRDSEALR